MVTLPIIMSCHQRPPTLRVRSLLMISLTTTSLTLLFPSSVQSFAPLSTLSSVQRTTHQQYSRRPSFFTAAAASSSSSSSSSSSRTEKDKGNKGKLLVLGGTGFLGQTVCKRAIAEGYQVTSLSRRGLPPLTGGQQDDDGGNGAIKSTATKTLTNDVVVDYRQGDARNKASIANILQEGEYVGIIHCIGLLLDEESGLSLLNRFVSGSGSVPDNDATYDKITRLTAFNAIDAATEYVNSNNSKQDFAFCFTSAAEAGWPDVTGGPFIESLVPEFLKRYLAAKRSVETKLLQQSATPTLLRPIIVRPSLIYSMDRPASFLSVGAFWGANAVGVPFVDRPVTVQSLASAMIKAIQDETQSGILRYPEIEKLSSTSSYPY